MFRLREFFRSGRIALDVLRLIFLVRETQPLQQCTTAYAARCRSVTGCECDGPAADSKPGQPITLPVAYVGGALSVGLVYY